MTDYFTKLKTLWDDVGAYLTVPHCNCTKEFNLSKFYEAERVHQFLMGLDTKQFGTIRSKLLAMEPLPSLNKAYAAILREERQQSLTRGVESKPIIEASAFRAAGSQTKVTNRPRCTHCQKLGHERSQCFELVGYPPNWHKRQDR